MSMRVLLKNKNKNKNQDHDINFLYCKSGIETFNKTKKRKKKKWRPVKGLSQSEAKEKSVKSLLRFSAPSAGCMSFICDMIG